MFQIGHVSLFANFAFLAGNLTVKNCSPVAPSAWRISAQLRALESCPACISFINLVWTRGCSKKRTALFARCPFEIPMYDAVSDFNGPSFEFNWSCAFEWFFHVKHYVGLKSQSLAKCAALFEKRGEGPIIHVGSFGGWRASCVMKRPPKRTS